MSTWLADPLVPVAWCWRVQRSDGVILGFTTHDAPLLIDDQLYDPAPGIRPSAIEQRGGIHGDVLEVEGAISGPTIRDDDVAAGWWNGAIMTLFVANWQDPALPTVTVAEGRIGNVVSDGQQFTAELSSRDPILDEPLVPFTSAECRAELGDARCGIALASRRIRARVVAVDQDVITLDQPFSDGRFGFGSVRFLSGRWRGLGGAVISQTGAELRVALSPAVTVAPGDWLLLTEGCDKMAATCTTRFGNIANFRGEPHLPGIDLLTRFPGG